jgi:hypothetical protein
MAINNINDAEIREYILGQSRAAKTELLDELSFIDEYSERFGAVEREVIDDYLAGRLSPNENLAFESHYLSTLARREKVDFAKAFATYSKRQLHVVPEGKIEGSFFDLIRNWRLSFQFAAAAMVVLFGIAGWLAYRSSWSTEIAQENYTNAGPIEEAPNAQIDFTPSPVPTTSATPLPTSADRTPASRPDRPEVTPTPRPAKTTERRPSLAFFALTPALRSSSFQQLKIPAGATTAELRLQLEIEEKGPFLVEVLDMRGRSRVWSARDLNTRKGSAGSMLSFRIPVRVLGPGEYQISVSRSATAEDPEKIGDYFFRVAP